MELEKSTSDKTSKNKNDSKSDFTKLRKSITDAMTKETKPNLVKPNPSLKYHMENRKLKKKIKLLEEQTSKKDSSSRRIIKFILFIVTIIIATYLYYKLDDIAFEQQKVKLSEISKELRSNVFHQHKAVELILQNLHNLNDKKWRTEMFVMPFVGTSGVSKTYVANIIKENCHPTYVQDVSKYSLLNNFEQTYFEILKSLQDCCNLIIIDNLSANDIEMTTRFIAALPKHKVVLVIPIFNIQDVTVVNNEMQFSVNDKCIENIVNNFTLLGLNFEYVLFRVITKYELETAIIQLMIQRYVDYAKCGHFVKEIVDNHDVATQGYKQLNIKLNVIWQCGIDNNHKNAK